MEKEFKQNHDLIKETPSHSLLLLYALNVEDFTLSVLKDFKFNMNEGLRIIFPLLPFSDKYILL